MKEHFSKLRENQRMTNLRANTIVQFASVIFFLNAPMVFGQQPTRNEWLKIATTGIFSTVTTLGLTQVETETCNWCRTNAFDTSISRALISDDLPSMYHSSDAMAFGVAPILALSGIALISPNFPLFARDALIVFNSLAVTALITEISKISARRARPEAVFGYRDHDEQSNRSFWSGHTSMTFALLSSASTLVLKRNVEWAPYFVAMSALAAGTVGYTRIAAAKHWATDVLMGMVVGTAVGIAMPFFVLDESSVQVAFNTYAVALHYRW